MDIGAFIRRARPASRADRLRRGGRGVPTRRATPNCNDRRTKRCYSLRQLIDGNAQRRHQHDNIPDRPSEESVSPGFDTDLCGKLWSVPSRGGQPALARLIQLYSRNKPALPDFNDARNSPQAGECLRQMLDFWLESFQDLLGFKDLEGCLGRRAAERVPSVAVSISKCSTVGYGAVED